MMVQSIIENLQRENLNPIEEARAYESLVEKGFTHAEIADKMGKSRPYISNSIRLLSLPEQILSEVENGKLSQAHARSLVGLNKEQQDYFFQRIIEEDISVRKLETLLTEKKQKKQQKTNHFIQNEEKQLRKLLGLDVEIKLSKKDSGKIIISFSNQEEYSRIINSLK
ncbi:chromosome partitioning protein [Streptococcus pneumoniae]|nr:chromosome partitioning protein [Streptococcus pneumoniae]